MLDPIYPMAFSTALLGSGHCLGMCGPVVAALSLPGTGRRRGFLFHLGYTMGRLTTYVCIGLAAGRLGALLGDNTVFGGVSQVLLILADLVVIMIGLRTTGLFQQLGFLRLEPAGPVKLLTGAVSGLRRLPQVLSAYPIGMIMGFLPCGFLYAIALAAVGRGSAVQGGAVMLAFGLGTVPAMLLFGNVVHWLSSSIRSELLRWAGFLVVAVGLYNGWNHLRDFL